MATTLDDIADLLRQLIAIQQPLSIQPEAMTTFETRQIAKGILAECYAKKAAKKARKGAS